MVLAIDANARSMADASRRAAAKPSRGGHSNVLFLAEGAERLPDSFDGLADVVTILFPWGSLLRGALGVDHAVATSIARLVAPGRNLSIVLSVVERDRAAIGAERPFGPSDVDAMADAFAPLGLDLTNARRLSPDEIRATGSTWARRLRSDDSRSIYRVELTPSRSSSYRSFTTSAFEDVSRSRARGRPGSRSPRGCESRRSRR